jgi:hypothetical protein
MGDQLVNLGIANQTPSWAQTDTSKQPTIKVEAPKQPIYIVDPNKYSAPKGIESVRGNKEKEVLLIQPKSESASWWKKRTKTQKALILGGTIVFAGIVSYLIYKKVNKK